MIRNKHLHYWLKGEETKEKACVFTNFNIFLPIVDTYNKFIKSYFCFYETFLLKLFMIILVTLLTTLFQIKQWTENVLRLEFEVIIIFFNVF